MLKPVDRILSGGRSRSSYAGVFLSNTERLVLLDGILFSIQVKTLYMLETRMRLSPNQVHLYISFELSKASGFDT